jgi:membrane-associated protein
MMNIIRELVDLFLHLDRHLDQIITQYGFWTYLLLFLIIFCETGLVVTPFLPGDSLLFAVGAFAARGSISLPASLLLLAVAAIVGDTVNYWIGRKVGPRVFHREDVRLFNRKHLDRTHAFYERHGGKTIVIARFLPIIRTFAPFVAGIGAMTYPRFVVYNMVGGALWVSLFVLAGYFFGNLKVVRDHFSVVILAIILVSVLPGLIEYLRHQVRDRRGASNGRMRNPKA